MAVIGIRQLSRETSRVIKEFEETGEPVILTREGQPIGALMPVDQSQLEDLVLATAPEFRASDDPAEANAEQDRTRSLEDAARERGIGLPSREEAVAEIGEEDEIPAVVDAIPTAHLRYATEHELVPLSKVLSGPVVGRMVSDASEEIGALSDEALGAIGRAEHGEPGENEVRELTELTAAVYGRLFTRYFAGQLTRGRGEEALEVSRLQTRNAMRLLNKSLVGSSDFSFDRYVASLRGMKLAWETEADEDETPTAPGPPHLEA
jgi:prevent-host-death family protein